MTDAKKSAAIFREILASYEPTSAPVAPMSEPVPSGDPGGPGASDEVHSIPVFTVSLKALAAGDLSNAREVGIQHYTYRDGKVQAGFGKDDLVSIEDDELAALLAKAVRQYQVEEANTGYRIRLLRVPSLPLEAVWGHKSPGSEDIFLPYRAPKRSLQVLRVYSKDTFLRELQPAAQAKARAGSAPE
jgi:hypothetical protein